MSNPISYKLSIKIIFFVLGLCVIATNASALDYPHTGINSIRCDSCHYVYSDEPSYLPPWTNHSPQDIDDTQFNTLCWSCHNDVRAAYVKTHSSLQIDNSYGDWIVECRVCHNPHKQDQLRMYGSSSYLFSGISTTIQINQPQAGQSQLTMTGAGWTDDQFQGLVLLPNENGSRKKFGYKILSNTADTITVKKNIDLTKVTPGVDTFAVIYGKLINSTVKLDRITNSTPPKAGDKSVRFFNATGTNSFADGDAAYDGVCEVCHTLTTHFRNDGNGSDQLHSNMNFPAGTNCTVCHKHENGFRGMGGGAHVTHVTKATGPKLQCTDCHGINAPPILADNQNTANTSVCNNCHSVDGAAMAKTYFTNPPDTWITNEGQASFCGGCHDETPANSQADGLGYTAPNIVGDNTTYGFFITGHGKSSGTYPRMSWQDVAATGNPAANKLCTECHDLSINHFNSGNKRLKAGYENDINNSNCKQCHDPGLVATASPQWYTTYSEFQTSAHSSQKCSDCHNVHGSSGNNPAMTKANQENLCYQCHTEGVVQNNAVSGSALADDIEQAFSFSDRHNLETSFSIGAGNYSLECVTCHNVHIVSGQYWQADQGKSPVSRVSTPSNPTNNTTVWGDDAGEKMDDYAGAGVYRTPTGDTFSGAQLPDYATFCLDCHGQAGGAPFGIDWNGRPHGKQSANVPNGGGKCPDWYSCGKATGWNGDDCIGTESDCWPVMTRGKGDQLWSRKPYNHEERIAGANFVMVCTDCHEAHGSGVRSMIRSNPNGGTGTTIWNTMCNNCHYYYSDWHAGMSCGTASCHVSDSIHRMGSYSGAGNIRTFDPTLVLHYAFESNLNDSGDWNMDAKWMDNITGSYASGKNGQAIVLDGGKNVQVGTTNDNWSTDEGYHATWKYTEMKFNTTLEAWVYPTDNALSDYSIFTKHVGYANGGYAFELRKVNGTFRASFIAQLDNNGVTQDGRAGLRGAYSSTAVPLNKWTHVAVTFDRNGADRNSNDPAVGRIRIYVNGEDVTTSDSIGNYMQPTTGETSIFAFPENNGWNQVGVCYNDSWCAGEFSVGGFYGWQNEFIGRIDEAKVWNVTKDSAYFDTLDADAGPFISFAEGVIGSDQLSVTLSEGSFTDPGSSGALQTSDFIFNDSDNGRTVTGVTHTAGDSTATLTLSSALDDTNDFNVDTLAPVSLEMFDEYDNGADIGAVAITLTSSCPTGKVTFDLNESSGSAYVFDDQTLLSGQVYGNGTLTGSEFSGSGDGSSQYIMFNNNDACLQASTAMTLEARIKPTGLAGTANYIRRVLARDGGGNYQMSVWRNNSWTNFNAPDGEASIALWVNVLDNHGGNNWKVVLTNYTGAATIGENECPIVSDHWYQVKAVWNSAKPGGTLGQLFVPADIYVDDQGTDGAGAGENWAGNMNCTDVDESLKETDSFRFYTADEIITGNGSFAIGANRNNPANNLFNGLIDWITWVNTAD